MRRGRSHLINLLHSLVQIALCVVGKKRDDGLAVQVITFEESANHHSRLMPPDRRSYEYRVVLIKVFGQIRHAGTQVVVSLVLNLVAVVIGILRIRFGRLYAVDIRPGKFGDPPGYALRIARSREIGDQYVAFTCRLLPVSVRIGRVLFRTARYCCCHHSQCCHNKRKSFHVSIVFIGFFDTTKLPRKTGPIHRRITVSSTDFTYRQYARNQPVTQITDSLTDIPGFGRNAIGRM